MGRGKHKGILDMDVSDVQRDMMSIRWRSVHYILGVYHQASKRSESQGAFTQAMGKVWYPFLDA